MQIRISIVPTQKPHVSIVIPVSNMAGRLQNLEKSIKATDPTIFQIIVVHDFRGADTSFELKELINRVNNGHIELYEGKFGSAGKARSEGMIHATGKYLVFWDSDDVGYPEQIVKVIEETVDVSSIYVDQIKDFAHKILNKEFDSSCSVEAAENVKLVQELYQFE